MANEQSFYHDKSFILKKLAIYPTEGNSPIDVTNLLVSLSLFEDIWSPTISGVLTISDSLDLITRLALKGNEFLSLILGKPGYDQEITRLYRIYRIEPGAINYGNQSNQMYSILFTTDDHLINSSMLISKSYKDKTIDEIVMDILSKQMKCPDSRIGTIEKTSTKYQIIIPMMRPLDSIMFAAARTDPIHLFYENRDGYQLRNLDKLLQQKSIRKYRFSPPNMTPELNQDTEYGVTNVFQYEYMDNFDALKAQEQGMYSSTLLTFDIIRQKFDKVELSYSDQFNKDTHLVKKPFHSAIQNRFKKDQTKMFQSRQRVIATNKDHDTTDYIKKNQPNIKPFKYETWLIQREMRIEQLLFHRLKLGVPGEMSITCGDIIEFGVPLLTTKDISSTNINERTSGKFLITGLRHLISQQNKFETIIECIRDGYDK